MKPLTTMTDSELHDWHKAVCTGDNKGPFFDPAKAKPEDIIFFEDKFADIYIGTEAHRMGLGAQGYPSHIITPAWLRTKSNWNHKIEPQEINVPSYASFLGTTYRKAMLRIKLAPEWWADPANY